VSADLLSIERTSLDQLAALLPGRAGLKIPPDGDHGPRLRVAGPHPAPTNKSDQGLSGQQRRMAHNDGAIA